MSQQIPPISELREKCQGEKLARDNRFWYIWFRKISIYITWVFLHTKITANQVTALSLIAILGATILLAFPQTIIALCGALVFLIYHFLDKVDGEIARYYQKFSITGIYLDELGHNLCFAGIFAGLGLHLAWQNTDDSILILASAMIGGLSMVMIRQNKSVGCLLFAQYVLEKPQLLPQSSGNDDGVFNLLNRETTHQQRRKDASISVKGWKKLLIRVRSFVLIISQFLIMYYFVVIGLMVEVFTGRSVFLEILLKVEALLQLMVLLALVIVNVKGNVKNECLRLNTLAKEKHSN